MYRNISPKMSYAHIDISFTGKVSLAQRRIHPHNTKRKTNRLTDTQRTHILCSNSSGLQGILK